MEFYFGLVCSTLLALPSTLSIPTAYPQDSEFKNCGFNLNATCDDHMELFADGKLLATSGDWKNTSVVDIPENTGEIEIRCTDGWILGGILASSENGLMTNNAWNCSSDNGTTWKHAHELGANGVTAEDISPDAKWIWTDRPTWTHTRVKRHTTAICKIQLPTNSVCGTTTTPTPTTTICTDCVPCLFTGTTPTPAQTPTWTPSSTAPQSTPGFNLNATCNDKMELFVDGNLLNTSYNWRDTSQVHIPAATQNIEIHCTDSCWLIEGILASGDNGLLTDDSWNCSSDNGITWSSAHEIVPNGLSVPDISPNAKWISTGPNTWRDGGKVICKVTLDLPVPITTTSIVTTTASPVSTLISKDCLYTDKYVECPDFKNQCKTGNFVACMNRDCAKTCKCHWSAWSPWSKCSASCGVAVKTRTRKCLQVPCPPERTEEAASCHLPSCGAYIQQKCFLEDTNITFLDLGRNHMHQDHPPVWKIADNGRRLTETLNTRPSIGLSNLGDITEPVSFSGRVFSASGDDDVIGMVFGFWNEANFFVIASARQHPGPTNWYVARLHATCTPGLSCATTTTISDAIWDPPSHPEDITVLATGNTPWQHGKQYNFTVCFNPSKLLLSVSVTNENDAGPILETGIISAKTNDSGVDEVSRKGGFVGVYVDSQARTTWDYLVCQDCHLIDPPPSKELVFLHVDSQYRYYKVPIVAGSKVNSAVIKQTCEQRGMTPQCYTTNYNDSNCLMEPDDSSPSYELAEIICGPKQRSPIKCPLLNNTFWYLHGWRSGAAWGVNEGKFDDGKKITITSDNQYFASCLSPTDLGFIRSKKGKYCHEENKKNALKEFIALSDTIEDAITSRDQCEHYCSNVDSCWGCSVHCIKSTCQWNAITQCKTIAHWDGKIEGDVTQKPGEGVLSLSSQYVNSKKQDFTASQCLDENLNTMCHTTNEKYPFLVMEYPNEVLVKKVKVVARAGKEANRVKQLIVSVTNVKPTRGQLVSGGKILGTFAGPASPAQEIMFTSEAGLRGKYVVIQQGYTGIINYAEIEITKETPGQRQRQQSFSGKRQQSSPKLAKQESLNILKKSERRALIKQSLPEQLEQDTSKIPSSPKNPTQGRPNKSSVPGLAEHGNPKSVRLPGHKGLKLEFQLKGKIGIEKVKISVDDTEEEIGLTTKWRLFSYPRPTTGSFSVEFLNDIGYTDVFIRGHEFQVTDLLPNFPANKFLGCGTKNEDEKCGILRKGTLMWNGKYTYNLKGQGS